MMAPAKSISAILANDSGVSPSYRHAPKWVTPGDSIETDAASFKWYAVHLQDQPVPEEMDRLARSYLRQNPPEAKGLGFIILHRCGKDFYFLIVNTWRGNNEVWETLFYKDGDAMSDFAVFPREQTHKPTFCVWELAAVWHEKQSWEGFLQSARDEGAAEVWRQDVYRGLA